MRQLQGRMEVLRKSAAPLIYFSGIGALMLCDVLVSSLLQVGEVAVWSRVRAIGGVLGIICLLGLDQFLLRHPEALRQVQRILFVQIPAIAIAAALIGRALSHPVYLTALIALFSSAAIAVSQYQRSRGRLVIAQAAAQSWKIIFLIGVSYYALDDPTLDFEYLTVACAVASLILTCSYASSIFAEPDGQGQWNGGLIGIYGVSIRLMAISALTSFSIYLEQLIVNVLGSDHDAALYFSHATYFLFSASLLNGYISFLAIPWAKQNRRRFMSIATKWMWLGIALSVFYVAVVQGIAALAWHVLEPAAGEIDVLLLLAFSASACSRTIYTYPSALLGAFGKRRHYTTVIRRYAFSLLGAVALFSALWLGMGLSLVHSVALASASNWLLRTLIGLQLARVAIRNGTVS